MRSLRVGIVLGGNLVEERVFDGPGPVTVGQSLKAALSVPVDGVPREHALFARREDGHWEVRAAPGMQVACAQGGGGMRGRVVAGEATLLFQEVEARAAAPLPKLPASVRGTFADRIDPKLALIVGGSIVLHVALAAWAWSTDVETPPLGAPTPIAEFQQETIDITIPEPPGAAAPSEAPGRPIPSESPRPVAPPRPRAPAPAPPRDLDAEALRYAAIIAGTDPGGAPLSATAPRRPGADLRDQIDDVRDRHLTIGDPTRTARGPREHLGTDPHPIVPGDAPQLTREQHRPDVVRERVVLRPLPSPVRETSTLTVEAVLAKITNAYLSSLTRCYQLGLARDASLSGKVTIAFTVTETGKTDDAEANGSTPEVDGCIRSVMGGWRFPIPKDKAGEPTDQAFRLALVLQAN